MTVPLWVWGATILGIVVLVGIDIWHARSPHEVTFREATFWSVLYIVVALLFGVGLWIFWDGQYATEYFAGWLVEKSLSVDNLFIFAVILAQFQVPKRHQQKVLIWGIVGALVMRAIFILIGAAVISAFAFAFVIFGAFLIYTAYGLLRSHGEEPKDMSDNIAVRFTRRVVTVHEEETKPGDKHDGQLTRRINGKWGVTPLFITVAVILSVDLVFALDSIPAIFGITQNAYLVFTANAFALLGLRALYFLIIGLLDRLVHLSYGLSFILAFIGVKLILHWLHVDISAAIPEVPTWLSLVVIVVTLTVVTITSLRATRGQFAEAGSFSRPANDSGDGPAAVDGGSDGDTARTGDGSTSSVAGSSSSGSGDGGAGTENRSQS